jgi:N-acetyl-gamma-glutamylphosphate reductase
MNNYASRVSIIGVTGYAVRAGALLASHEIRGLPDGLRPKRTKSGAEAFSPERLRSLSPDAVVLATEHERPCRRRHCLLSEGYRVVDMSGAFG